MTTLFIILIVLASGILSLIVLVQNPKGGGLAGNIAGFSNQFMGVKQTTDVLEKGTWIFGGVIAALCLLSVVFLSKTGTAGTENKASGVQVPATNQPAATPQGTLTLPQSQPATTPAKTP
ncbi:MAG: preprotein translocase subunit SecG [Chitinophagaceae bacterium]